MHPDDVYGGQLCGLHRGQRCAGQFYPVSHLFHRHPLSGEARHQPGKPAHKRRKAGLEGCCRFAVLRPDHRLWHRLCGHGRRHDDADRIHGLFRHGAENRRWHQHLHHDLHRPDRFRQLYPDSSRHPAGKVGRDAAVHRCGYGGQPAVCPVCQPGQQPHGGPGDGRGADIAGQAGALSDSLRHNPCSHPFSDKGALLYLPEATAHRGVLPIHGHAADRGKLAGCGAGLRIDRHFGWLPWGKHKIKMPFAAKSWEGTAAMFAAALLAGLGVLCFFGNDAFWTIIPDVLLGVATSAATELFSTCEWDTVTVPVAILTVLLCSFVQTPRYLSVRTIQRRECRFSAPESQPRMAEKNYMQCAQNNLCYIV